jgi:integrase
MRTETEHKGVNMVEKVNFTKMVLLDIPSPEKGRSYLYDSKINGLLIMITAAGAKSFQVRKSVKGKAARITLGRFPAMTVQQARDKAMIELSLIANTKQTSYQVKAEKRKNDGLTLRKAFDDYLKSHRNLKPATVRDYEKSVRVGFPEWKELPLTKITRDMVETRHRERSEQSEARANNEMRVLRSVFNYAMEEYLDADGKAIITANPVKRLSHSNAWNKAVRRKTIIKPDELPAWFEAVDTLPEWYGGKLAYRTRVYFLMCLFSGYRRTECASATWENIDLTANTILLLDTKNGLNHELPLTTYTHDLLQEWQGMTGQTTGLVFRATDELSPLSSVESVIDAIREKTGLHWAMHDLRRTFTTTAETHGIRGYTLKRLINHKTGAADVTGGYIITDVDSLREPMQAITDKLLMLVSAKLPASKTATAESKT